MKIIGAGGIVTKRYTKLADVSILHKYGTVTQIEYIVMNEGCGNVLSIKKGLLDLVKQQFNAELDNLVTKQGKMDILIGLTSPQLHKQFSSKGQPNQLHVIETLFGPCLVGPVPEGDSGNYIACGVNTNVINIEKEDVENGNLAKFLQYE